MPVTLDLESIPLVTTFSGVVTFDESRRALEEIEAAERSGHLKTWDRISDARAVIDVHLDFSDVFHFGQRRTNMPIPVPFKSAFVVATQLGLGFARMFQSLNRNPQITIEVFETMDHARDWIAGKISGPPATARKTGRFAPEYLI